MQSLWPLSLLVCMLAGALVGGGNNVHAQSGGTSPSDARSVTQASRGDAAFAFIEETEMTLVPLIQASALANWTATVSITDENLQQAAEADAALATETVRRGMTARGLSSSDPLIRRKLERLRVWADGLNNDSQSVERRTKLRQQMASFYERTCAVIDEGRPCMLRDAIEREFRAERNPERLRRLWKGWYDAAAPQAERYREYTELLNRGARDAGRRDAAEVSLAAYEVEPAAFERQLDDLWSEVRPLYQLLHAYARVRLAQRYPGEVDAKGPIPMHLLGNLWGQEWEGIVDVLLPNGGGDTLALDRAFAAAGLTSIGMVELAARFFQSLGYPALPRSFWERSHFSRPLEPDGKRRANFACHPTAWAISAGDWRLSVCFEPTWSDLLTAHHEIGHIFYYQSFDSQPLLFREAPNEGINEAIGDSIMLSVTPAYLKQVGFGQAEANTGDVDALLRIALRKIARIPFGLALQRWRWGVQSGHITPDRYNDAWWELVREYQGIAPPASRSPGSFDPAAKYHIAADIDYVRYFLADVLTFQIHDALVRIAGCTEPSHRCSVHGSREAGARLRAGMAMGASRSWQDVLKAITGSGELRGQPLRAYFAPLDAWLLERTKNAPIGW